MIARLVKGTFLKVTATDNVPKKGQKHSKWFIFVVLSGIQAIEGCYKLYTNKGPLIIETMN